MVGQAAGLDGVLLNAMLNSCTSTKEEILLAVAWGERSILETKLEGTDVTAGVRRGRCSIVYL